MHGCAIRPRPGCPSSFAGSPCGDAFDIGPTIRYLHAALQQAVSLFNGDPDNVVITGWRGAGSPEKPGVGQYGPTAQHSTARHAHAAVRSCVWCNHRVVLEHTTHGTPRRIQHHAAIQPYAVAPTAARLYRKS